MAKTLKATLKTLDGLSDQDKELYVQKDNLFVLSVESVDGWALENVAGLRSALERERGEHRMTKEKISKFGDLDPDAARAALARSEEMQNWSPDKKTQELIEERVSAVKKAHQKELEAEKASAQELDKALREQLIDNATHTILGGKGSVRLLLPIIKESAFVERDSAGRRVVRIKNPATGNPRASQRSGNGDNLMTLEEFVMDVLANDKEYAAAFAKSNDGGSGAANGASGGSGSSGRVINRAAAFADSSGDLIDKIASGAVKVND